jgi:hypothetical protein
MTAPSPIPPPSTARAHLCDCAGHEVPQGAVNQPSIDGKDGVASSILAGGSNRALTSGNAGQFAFRIGLASEHDACPPHHCPILAGLDPNAPHSLRRSFELRLRAENRAPNTIAGCLESIRQAEAFLASRGKTLQDADRTDLEAFMVDLLSRRSASTAATRYKGLRAVRLAGRGGGDPEPHGVNAPADRPRAACASRPGRWPPPAAGHLCWQGLRRPPGQ